MPCATTVMLAAERSSARFRSAVGGTPPQAEGQSQPGHHGSQPAHNHARHRKGPSRARLPGEGRVGQRGQRQARQQHQRHGDVGGADQGRVVFGHRMAAFPVVRLTPPVKHGGTRHCNARGAMSGFDDFAGFRRILAQAPGPDAAAAEGAAARNAQLTKPPAALGRLEDLAAWYPAWRADPRPAITAPQVIIFAGNHGVAARGVSAFPAEVTVQMVANFRAGGAAINQLARLAGARMDVHALDLDQPTADFTQGPAMTEAECLAALQTGWDAVDAGTDLLVVGEMGIAYTTSAAAIACALLGGEAGDWTGRGTGVDDKGLSVKTQVVAEGVARHAGGDGIDILARLGGREIAAMAGAIARARDGAAARPAPGPLPPPFPSAGSSGRGWSQ